MPNLFSSLMGTANKHEDIQTLANDMLMGAKMTATAYHMAGLEASTPELRNLYFTHMNQIIEAHTALTQLAVSRNWYTPYLSPDKQLAETYSQSQTVVDYPRA